ncbi:hypothetical protein PybrP1_007692 [[Pythium] brassicae (nom. inval.)]|nr:hypothetical protein PybrP1_007692 [[Pythium] brassicae (nom. inval.)]
MSDDGGRNSSPAPPAFTLPTRSSPVSLSSLLSSESDHCPHPNATSATDSVAPITLPPPSSRRPRGALSNLMNSPMDDDPRSPQVRREDAAAPTVAPADVLSPAPESPRSALDHSGGGGGGGVLDTLSDLGTLQRALQRAALRLATADEGSGGPPVKRQKKGKHGRKPKASAITTDESAAEMHKCVELLSLRVQNEAAARSDTVRFCLALCSELSEKDPIEKSVVKRPKGELDVDATLAALTHKPLFVQLLSVVRRAVLSADDDGARELLAQVLAWCCAAPTPAHWSWVLAFVGQHNSFAVLEFLVHSLIFSGSDQEDDAPVAVPTIEYLVAQSPAQLVDIVRDLVDAVASEAAVEVRGKSPLWLVKRLVSVATQHPVFLRACDDSLQFFVTKDLVLRVASKPQQSAEADDAEASPLSDLLLQLLERRSAEMAHSSFQLILLLQALSTPSSDVEDLPLASTAELAGAAAELLTQVLVLAEREAAPRPLLTAVQRFLPYICQSALRSLRPPQRPAEMLSFEHWRRWLELIARRGAHAEVTTQLIDADLMLSEVSERASASSSSSPSPALSAEAVAPEDAKLSELLSSILAPLSADYVAFVKEMMRSCNASAPRARQRRVLRILQALLRQNGHDLQQSRDDSGRQLPVDLRVVSGLTIGDAVEQIVRVEPWSETWRRLEMWKGAEGVNAWEGFVDLACSRDPEVASRALALVSQTPFQALEDPMWQYRCLRKLTSVFFHLLRQFRAESVSAKVAAGLGGALEASETQQRLETMKAVLFRVLALDGGVAHYASSVSTTFASLWIDALFSTTSPTSVPTHFPNRVNFSTGGDDAWDSGANDRVVIRSERTISSKCTNLQASQVITQVSDTLVYRKALDASWEREMDAARTCSMFATDVVLQLLSSTVASSAAAAAAAATGGRFGSSDHVERKLKTVTELLLERAIPCCGIPSDDVYKETLPNRSSHDMDLRIEQWLNHFPSFLPLLRAVVVASASVGSTQSLRLVPLVKSALVVLLGHWNSVKGELSRDNMDVPPYMRNRNQLALTCELVQILRLTGWLPPPLGRTAELLPLTTPADIRGILFSCWFYLSDHPPSDGLTPTSSRAASPTSAASSPSATGGGGGGASNSHAHVPLEFYLVPLRKALHTNIRKIGAKYPLFMC